MYRILEWGSGVLCVSHVLMGICEGYKHTYIESVITHSQQAPPIGCLLRRTAVSVNGQCCPNSGQYCPRIPFGPPTTHPFGPNCPNSGQHCPKILMGICEGYKHTYIDSVIIHSRHAPPLGCLLRRTAVSVNGHCCPNSGQYCPRIPFGPPTTHPFGPNCPNSGQHCPVSYARVRARVLARVSSWC